MGGRSAANLARAPIFDPQSNQRTPRGKADSALCQRSLAGKKGVPTPAAVKEEPEPVWRSREERVGSGGQQAGHYTQGEEEGKHTAYPWVTRQLV